MISREKKRVYDIGYRATHRQEQMALQAAYYAAHRQEIQAYQASYYISHRDKMRVRGAIYYATHCEKLKVYQTAQRANGLNWARTHLEEASILVQCRNARKKALPSTLTADQWVAIKEAYAQRCAYCGEKSERLTQEHVIPVSKGGGYTADNIVPACGPCNSSKGDRQPALIPAVRLLL